MKKRILVVDDNEQHMYLASFLLEKKGHEVIPAKTGLEAIEKVKTEKPDLILMDMQLPEMDGFEATRIIRNIPGFAHIPIVAVTSYAMTGDREKAILSGCVGYIEKPFLPETFISQVEKYLRREGDDENPDS